MTESVRKNVPGLLSKPHIGVIDSSVNHPMHLTGGPLTHNMIHEIGKIRVLSLVHHVMMFVDMNNELRCRELTMTHQISPFPKGMVVFLNNDGHRTIAPM
jgi:hypothetical protein